MHKTKNTWRIDGDTLVLLNRADGVEIYCPAASAPYVLQHTWCITYCRGKVARVLTTIPDPRGGRSARGRAAGTDEAKRSSLFLHALILENAPEKVRRPGQIEVDHKDGNPLNNRLDNLRYVTTMVNQQNIRDAQGNPKRGVSYNKLHGSWAGARAAWNARISIEGKIVGNKYFSTAREAEEHYLIWKRQYHTETPGVWYEQYATCQASGYWD